MDIISNIEERSSKAMFVYSYAVFETTPITYDILQRIVDRYIRKYSSESLLKYLTFFEKTTSIKLDINAYEIEKISEMRNHIVHDNVKYSLLYSHIQTQKVLLNSQDMIDCMKMREKTL